MEEDWGKLKGAIVEISRGVSSWIWFGERRLNWLLREVEDCCKGEDCEFVVKRWEEDGRKYIQEKRSNAVGRFLLCSVVDLDSKRFFLSVP